jgi:hypothetical protein
MVRIGNTFGKPSNVFFFNLKAGYIKLVLVMLNENNYTSRGSIN